MLACVVTLVGLLALELILRRFYPLGGQVYVLDDELLFDAAPRTARVQRVRREYLGVGDAARVVVRIGPDGFRGEALERPKSRGRVLFVGSVRCV